MIQTAKDRVTQLNDYLADSDADRWLKFEYAGFYRWNIASSYKIYIPVDREYLTIYRGLKSYMDTASNNTTIKSLRNQFSADMVAVIANDVLYRYCGLGYIAAPQDKAYFAVEDSCYSNATVLAHEAGHTIGLNHDYNTDQSNTPYPYGHGHYSEYIKRRTIMSYDCPARGCRRVAIFSNPNVNYPGFSTKSGTYTQEYNVKALRYRAPVVSAFRSAPTSVTEPRNICDPYDNSCIEP